MPRTASTRTISIQVRHEDYEWLEERAKNGVYGYPSTYARYLLAEKIGEVRASETGTSSKGISNG